MTADRMFNIIRLVLAAFFLALFVWACCNRFTAGTVIGIVLFGGAAGICAFYKPLCVLFRTLWETGAGKALIIVWGTLALAVVGFAAFCTAKIIGSFEVPIDDPQAVIVLGCQVKGEEPSLTLQRRLDAAVETLEEYPRALCVLSGGRGDGENISEAEAMRRYLKARGISEERLLLEDKSTSTSENLRFSAAILKERGIDRVIIVTSEFHQYRAGIFALRYGLTAGHHSSRTKTIYFMNYFLREWAAIAANHFR